MDRPFLAALLPRDQTFEDDEAAVHMQKQEEANAEAIKAAKADQEKENSNAAAAAAAAGNEDGDITDPAGNKGNTSLSDLQLANAEIMENPFTRPVKMPLNPNKRKFHSSPWFFVLVLY